MDCDRSPGQPGELRPDRGTLHPRHAVRATESASYIHEPADDALSVLQQAFRVLAPHRLFTLSHLRYYLDRNPGLRAGVTNLHWSIEDL
jgi:hypothetical protein